MLDFNHSGSYSTDRGTLYFMEASEIPGELWDPCFLNGEHVMIDGQERVVKGVETFCIARSIGHPYRLPFGLLVE